MPFEKPVKKDSHLVVLYGNLAPEGGVAKLTGKEGLEFSGTARVFEGEEKATAAILAGKVKAGDVVVIRGEGPVGGPGMREMLSPTGAIMGRGLGDKVALITDGRFLGRQSWLRGRTYLAGSRARRPHRAAAQRRPHLHRREAPQHRRRSFRCGNESAEKGLARAQAVYDEGRAGPLCAHGEQRQPRSGHIVSTWGRFVIRSHLMIDRPDHWL